MTKTRQHLVDVALADIAKFNFDEDFTGSRLAKWNIKRIASKKFGVSTGQPLSVTLALQLTADDFDMNEPMVGKKTIEQFLNWKREYDPDTPYPDRWWPFYMSAGG